MIFPESFKSIGIEQWPREQCLRMNGSLDSQGEETVSPGLRLPLFLLPFSHESKVKTVTVLYFKFDGSHFPNQIIQY